MGFQGVSWMHFDAASSKAESVDIYHRGTETQQYFKFCRRFFSRELLLIVVSLLVSCLLKDLVSLLLGEINAQNSLYIPYKPISLVIPV